MNIPEVRENIRTMSGYVPGEQPKWSKIVKLNTNENPYPPSPRVGEILKSFDFEHLRRYPDPVGQALREEIAAYHGISPDQVLCANGSDDVLTIVSRCFIDEKHPAAFPVPTYSLYRTLAELQCAQTITVPLEKDHDFALPSDFAERIRGASLLFLARPNAPTGNTYPMEMMERLCSSFSGMILFDEAYADFSCDNCAELVKKYRNVLVSRTFSKSRSLAGVRFGYVTGDPEIITELMKAKDSYNVNMMTQAVALASFRDRAYLAETTARVCATRVKYQEKFLQVGFRVIPSQTNFLFASPPDGDGKSYFEFLRTKQILVRYFPGETTGAFVRISIGTEEDMSFLFDCTLEYLQSR